MVGKYVFFRNFLFQVQSGTITKYQPDFRPGSFLTKQNQTNRSNDLFFIANTGFLENSFRNTDQTYTNFFWMCAVCVCFLKICVCLIDILDVWAFSSNLFLAMY